MLTILNDTHIGAIRSAGTTPATQWQLRQRTLDAFSTLLPSEGDLLLNGDLFDTFNIPIFDLLKTYEILHEWMNSHPQNKLFNSAGNHDKSKTSSVMSSFGFLGKLLAKSHPTQYVHIEVPTMTPWGYVIPHLANQDLFNAALTEVPACKYLFLHCNYDNNFAAQSDHSLNLSAAQAASLPVEKIILAHEHHGRTAGKVVVSGNQIATSVSDWLSPGDKVFTVIRDDMTLGHATAAIRSAEFCEQDWKALELTDHPFIRVTGTATAEEGKDVVTLIAKYRQRSPALVITNGVRILGADGEELIVSSVEQLEGFDIWTILKELLSEEDYTTLKGLKNV